MLQKPKNILKTYICADFEPYGKRHIDKEQFLPSVAYMRDGKIKDFMFDSFIFLSSPNYVYDFSRQGAPKKEKTKENWLDFLHREEFAEGKNIDALNAAVGDAKKALNNKDYKANVFLTLFYPVSTVKDFGEVNGKRLDFSVREEQITALKWYVDEAVKTFKHRNYENVNLAGFYWFHESVRNTDDTAIHHALTDYVRSLGYITLWGPYFGARGHDFWQSECAFDMVAMQANYFPGSPGLPNCGTVERLKQVAEITKANNMGVELEWAGEVGNTVTATGFKQYMKAGIDYGFINNYHYFFMMHGPVVLKDIFCSDDTYTRSVYDELYAFLKGTLKENDIILNEATECCK